MTCCLSHKTIFLLVIPPPYKERGSTSSMQTHPISILAPLFLHKTCSYELRASKGLVGIGLYSCILSNILYSAQVTSEVVTTSNGYPWKAIVICPIEFVKPKEIVDPASTYLPTWLSMLSSRLPNPSPSLSLYASSFVYPFIAFNSLRSFCSCLHPYIVSLSL